MTKKDWRKLEDARVVLGLGEKATPGEIKKAYRRKAKENHPDLTVDGNAADRNRSMRELTAAYRTLLAYCENFSIPLVRPDNEEMDPEDWWMDRFGQDPLWGKG